MKDNELKIRPNQTYHEMVIRDDWKKYLDKRYWEYRNLWNDLPLKRIVSPFPLHLDIETTTICNLRCPMCPRTIAIEKGIFTKLGNMGFEAFKRVIDQAAKGGVYSIKLNYLGEPLLHSDIVSQVEYAKKSGILDVMLNTNGVLLTKEMSLNLLNAGIGKLFLSFDSPYREAYENIRIGAKFDRVIENIRYFYKLKSERYPHVQVRVSMVMIEDQDRARKDFIDLFKDTVDAIGFDEYRDVEDRSVKPVINGFVCSQLYQRMFIRQNGNAVVCCGDDRQEYIVGNWEKEPLKEIWVGEKYKNIRTEHEQGRYNTIGLCSKCNVPMAQDMALKRDIKK